MKPKTALYVRVSTTDKQTTESQRHELRQWCKKHRINSDAYKWYSDHVSGATADRPALNRLLADVRKGKVSTVVVYKLDRMSRNTQHGLHVLHSLAENQARFVSIGDGLEFSGPMGAFVATLLLAVATLERENIRQRVISGIAASRDKNGGSWGRKPDTAKRREVAKLREKGLSVIQIAEQMNCTRSNIYQLLEKTEATHRRRAV